MNAEKLKELRTKAGFTQEELAKKFKVKFLSDEVMDLLFSKEAEKGFEVQAAEAIKELEGIKGQQVLLHEYVHSVTEKFMRENPKHDH